jgi:hypothetical protein
MPEINNNFNNSSFSKKSEENNKKRSKLPSRGQLFIVFSLVILIVAGTFLFIYLNPEAVEKRKAEKNTEDFIEIYEGWEKQLSEDTYGGKTPQETLDMFIKALRSGDLELASKFFSPEIDEDNPEELTWQGHLEYLKGIEEKGFIERMANDFQKFDDDFRWSENVHWFVFYNEDGSTELEVSVSLNKDSGVWKIENFYE